MAYVLGDDVVLVGESGGSGGQHAGGDAFDDVAHVPGGTDAVGQGGAGRGDRTARVVAQHDDERAVQHAHPVLDAAEDLRARDVARGADDEQVTDAAVEDDLGGQPRIGAAEEDGEGTLGRSRLGTARRVLVRVLGCARGETPVAGQQQLEGLGRSG